MGKWCLHASLFFGNKDMFKSFKRFDFWHVQTLTLELLSPKKKKKKKKKTIALLFENYSSL